ncbi:MAG: caspase family protein [Sulfurimonas sp.]|jgi:WD40 repeat protein
MKPLLQALLCLTAFLTITAFASDPILKIDSGGHQGRINDIIITKSGDIISASDDKTIRVWDSRTGVEKRKILGQIGGGSEGMIYAIALSADEKVLAVGGYLNENGNYEYGTIRLYDTQSGKLLQLLTSHTNVVSDLAFDRDGNLYSASGDTSVKVWSKNSGGCALSQTLTEHSNQVYAIKPLKNGRFVSAGFDKKIVLYEGQKAVRSYTHTQMLNYIAVSDRTIATCGAGNEILIFDTNLNLLKTITSPTVPTGLAFSPDGSRLVAGTGANPYKIILYDVNQDFKELVSFEGHNNLTIAVAFLDNDTVVSGGGADEEIILWSANNGQPIRKMVGNGKQIWRVGTEGNRLGFGNSWNKVSQNERGAIEKVFDLASMSLQSKIPNQDFHVIDSRGLSHSAGGEHGYQDALLNLPNGKTILRDATTGLEHNTYGWDSTREFILSGGMNGHLKAYDKEGKPIANFIGHTGEVWNIAVDGETMVSGGTDQVVCLWDLSSLRNQSARAYNEEFISRIMRKYNITRESVLEQAKKMNNQNIYLIPSILPKLSLFVGTDDEWVMWSPSGYYASSPKGDRYIGWHINQGSDKEALFFPVGKFKSRYYNPELITLIAGGLTEERALAKLGEKAQTISISESLPPYITFAQYPEVDTQNGDVNLKVRVVSREEILEYKYLFDGRPLENVRAIKPKLDNDIVSLSVTVPKKSGTLSIVARNRFGYSDPVEFKINYLGNAGEMLKPNLYILSIGVANYQDKSIALEYSAKDANDFANVFKKQQGKLYRDVVIKTMTDSDANKNAILDGLEWIQKQTTAKDIAMVFIAGHGVNDENGNFYYLPFDYEESKLKRTGVPFSEFKTTLSSIAGKVILFADACHSGNIMGKRRAIDTNGLIAELNDAENGVVVFTSSTGKQYSLEDKAWNNGAFTKALVEGINGQADFLKSGKITVDSLSFYVSERVKALTNGKQTPTGSKPNTIVDFPIGLK